jgi:UDP-N-acetylmuramoyl-L-alanyl-D-glutamate--2,6-diaminopimelate ligase
MNIMYAVRSSIFYQSWKLLKARYAKWIWWNPWHALEILWVTGTDWKTSVCTILSHLLINLWHRTMMVGTNGVFIDGKPVVWVEKMTSYDPLDLQRLLARALDLWVTHVVMEVSSHGLDQQRFEWVPFRAAVLTNIAEEHLDYHLTMKHYIASKRKLFEKLKYAWRSAIAVFPNDDPVGRKWEKKFQFKYEISYGLSWSAKLSAKKIVYEAESTSFQVERSATSEPMSVPMIGEFNLRNTLAAMSVCLWLGHNLPEIITAMQWYNHASWRQQYINLDGTHCYIDFAHTPQWLEAMLTTLKKIRGNDSWKIICVFWAPGKRDRKKRPLMASIVEKYSDIMIVTDDDASSENRRDILWDVHAWVSRELCDTYYLIPKRRDAISLACKIASPWDYVLLAGKWHEKVLVTNFGKEIWDDEVVLKEEWKKNSWVK